MQSNARFVYLFGRYMDKSYTPAEKEEFMAGVQQPGYEALLRVLLRQASEEGMPPYEQPAEKADAIFSAIVRRQPKQRIIKVRPLLRYAAVVMVIAATGWGIYYYPAPAAKPVAVIPAPPAPAKKAEHRYIILPDGSKVLLNSGSRLDYPAAFNGRRREVYLQGEGYFDIKHDAHKPFIVHAGKIKTVVLGTAFDIKAFAGQDKVVVTVTRGKVRVENERTTLGILTPNEQLTVSNQNEAPAKQLVKTEEVMRWKADDVLFDDIPLSEAVAELEKRFSIRIVLENPALGNCRVTASFLHQETAEAIIRVLCGINHMQYRNTAGNNITLSGEGCR